MSAATPLSELLVLNRRHGAAPAGSVRVVDAGPLGEACAVRTCLREVLIGTRASLSAAGAATLADYEQFSGAEAYGFLLRLACGLESEIAGETEILGQVKQAWRDHERDHPLAARRIRHWMQRLLQETKDVRSEHVINLGSATYGSLVRRLLGGRIEGATLLVGAGQLAATVLPYLPGAELRVWNRTPARALDLLAGQRTTATDRRFTVLPATEQAELDAWHDAHDVVLCVPIDPARDAARVAAWKQRRTTGGRVLHLGILGATGTPWDDIDGLVTLGELFALRDAQAEQRDALLARARRACFEKAQLARLDDADGTRPGSSSHGWEDLAAFIA